MTVPGGVNIPLLVDDTISLHETIHHIDVSKLVVSKVILSSVMAVVLVIRVAQGLIVCDV
jgi:hypothetical protein